MVGRPQILHWRILFASVCTIRKGGIQKRVRGLNHTNPSAANQVLSNGTTIGNFTRCSTVVRDVVRPYLNRTVASAEWVKLYNKINTNYHFVYVSISYTSFVARYKHFLLIQWHLVLSRADCTLWSTCHREGYKRSNHFDDSRSYNTYYKKNKFFWEKTPSILCSTKYNSFVF